MSNILQVLKSLVVSPADRAQGVDLSHWDQWFKPETATKRIDFAFMKCTEGTRFVDYMADEIWSGVKQIPVRGGYHYQRSGMSWVAQADHYLTIASKYDFHVHALDAEEYGNVYNDTFFADTRRIIDRWRLKVPTKKVIYYSNWNTYKQLYAAIVRLYPDGKQWMDDLDFWYAWPSSILTEPVLPLTRNTWQFWQKSWIGKPEEWGAGSFVDLNEFNGTPKDLWVWAGLSEQPPVEPEPEPEPPPIVVEPPMRPEITPESRLWSAAVITLRRMVVRTYPIVAEDTIIRDEDGVSVKVYGGELFRGVLWSGNNYVWIRIDEYSSRPTLIGKWVAVRTTDGTEQFIRLQALPSQTHQTPQLWQVLHDAQMGEIRRPTEGKGAPEIFPLIDKHFTFFTKGWQEFSFELMGLPSRRWRAVFTWQRVLTNENGFDKPGDPRADWINKLNLESPNPKYASLLFGGNVVTGRVDGDWLWVETLDGLNAPPSVAWVRERPWLIQVCTNVQYDTGKVFNFPQGDGLPVIVPILASKPARFPLSGLKKLPLGSPIPKVYWP